jgi:hypothetical protein
LSIAIVSFVVCAARVPLEIPAQMISPMTMRRVSTFFDMMLSPFVRLPLIRELEMLKPLPEVS